MMRVMFSISCFGPSAENGKKLKERMEALMKEFGVEGKCDGMDHEQFASFHGNFCDEKKQENPSKYESPYGKEHKPSKHEPSKHEPSKHEPSKHEPSKHEPSKHGK